MELAARLEDFRMGSRTGIATAVGPRDRSVPETGDRVWTFGVNWYLNRYVLLQANAVRERRTQESTAAPRREVLWSRVFRVQFEL